MSAVLQPNAPTMSTGTDVDIIGSKGPIIEPISESHEVMTADPGFCTLKGQSTQTSARAETRLQMNDLHLLTGQDGADGIHQWINRAQRGSPEGPNSLQKERQGGVTFPAEKH